ncbi:MAG: T9SS type A sorting domain-containing protein [Bacteroidota bacterium]
MKTNQQHSVSSGLTKGLAMMALLLLLAFTPGWVKAQWNTNTSVNIQISGLPTADIQSVATTDGKTWIAFYHQNGGNYDMRAQLIDANGYKLLGPDGMLVSNQVSGSATFVFNVCVDASNNLIIGNQDERSGSDQAVLYKISQAGAQLWGAAGVVLGGGLSPYPCALSNGEVAVAWNETTSNTLKLQKITTGGTPAWGTPISIVVGTSNTTRGQIVANSAGKFTVVYQKRLTGISTTLYSQMYDNAGTALYAPLQICNQTTSGARYYSIVAEVDTTYFGYYAASGSRFNSFLQRMNPGGTIPWGMNGSNFNTAVGGSDSYQGTTNINMTPGSNYVWSVCTFSNPNQTTYGVYIQKFLKTTGARQFTDLAKVVYAISANTDQQWGEMALVNDTPMFMTEDVVYKIYATRLDANGDFVWPGNRIELSSTTATLGTPKMRNGFTPDGPNRCAGVWTENRTGNYMGYAQGVSIGGLVGLTVATQGSVPATITLPGGTLQMVATVFPATANQNVTWSIVPGTGTASISATGLVTAGTNGTVYAKATAVQDITVKDSLLVTISNQASFVPSVITLAATAVTGTTATLNGTVNANSATTTVSFNWGLTVAYGNTVAATPPTVSGNTVTAVLTNLAGLLPATTYHFRVTGTNAVGTTNGNDLSFTTPAISPTVITNGATNVVVNGAQLNGSVTANNSSTTVSFDYGLTISYGSNIAATPGTVTGTSPTAVLATLGGLPTLTLYHYRCVGINTAGTSYGADMTFTTGCQTPVNPGAITGPASVCQGQTGVVYSVPAITNATSYTWTVPTGGSITAGAGTNSITVSYSPTAVSGNVTVTGTNSCATGPTGSLAVTVYTQPVPTIVGTNTLCAGSGTYAYSTEPGMSNYSWSVSTGGMIVSGTGTNTIQIVWSAAGAQTVSVSYTNGNGCQAAAPTVYNVTVNGYAATPGAITGIATLCAGTHGVPYSVAPVTGALSYVWTLPAGATIATGFGTNAITVDFALGAVSGAITVMGNNLCGNGPASSLSITVNPIPPTPVISANGYLLTSSAPSGNQWYFNGNTVAGATGQTLLATGAGWYATVVTLNGCASDTSNRIYIVVGINEKSPANVSIYPVPNDGSFTIAVSSVSAVTYRVEVYNSLGVKIFGDKTITVSGTTLVPVDLRPIPAGLYTVILKNNDNQVVSKILVNR